VSTKALNQAVKRNLDRFPVDFMIQLTPEEYETIINNDMRSQFVTASKRNIRYLPYAFTEHGALMAATVLNSPKAVEVSVFVMRAFVQMRQMLLTHSELALQLSKVEKRLQSVYAYHEDRLDSHDNEIERLIELLSELMAPKRPIGFRTSDEE